jgi:hypothetical protein
MNLPRPLIASLTFLFISALIATPAYMRSTLRSTTFMNSPPVAVNDFYTVHSGRVLSPLDNDSDPGESMHIESFTQPSHGWAGPHSAFTISYTATYAYVGPDTLTYTVCDTASACATATVNIDVVNQPPVAQTDSYTVHGSRQLIPTENDSDPDSGDTINTQGIVTQPQHGTLSINTPNVFSYAAYFGYVGSDSFTYRICDSLGSCSDGTVNLNVAPTTTISRASIRLTGGLSTWVVG